MLLLETEIEFIFCVEDADIKFEDNLQAAWWKKTDKKFIEAYPNFILLLCRNLQILRLNLKIMIDISIAYN